MKSCFEILRINKEMGKVMQAKSEEFRLSREHALKSKIFDKLKSNMEFKQKVKQIPVIQKRLMFRRFVNHVQTRIEKKKQVMAKYDNIFNESLPFANNGGMLFCSDAKLQFKLHLLYRVQLNI